MTVAVAIDYRPALLGSAGIGRAVRCLASGLATRADVQLHLFAHSLAPAARGDAIPAAARLHRWPIPGRALPWLARRGLGADRLAGGAPVFHWTDYVHPPVTAARVVLTVHDLAFTHDTTWHGDDAATLTERTRTAIRRADRIVVPSRATATDVRTFAPDAPAPVVIPFGADHVHPPADDTAGTTEPYLACLGTIEPRKNHRTLLAALRRLRPPRPRLLVVGRIGWACDAIVADLEEAERDGLVEWLRDAEDEQALQVLAGARALVYPSLWEGFGFPPLEAMALGVPVIAHDCAPLQELTDGAATLCDARSPEALAAAIERVLGDAAHRSASRAAGLRRAAAFRWADCAAAHAEVYREAMR